MNLDASEASPPATVSVDVDPVDLHLSGHGYTGLEPDSSVYRVAIPRLLGHLAGADIRATFFFVGRDAVRARRAIRAVAAAGHEIASHSMTHPRQLTACDPKQLRRELRASRERLEDAAGCKVTGFRAPNWDLDAHTARALIDAGYRYDASGYPTPLLAAARLLAAAKSRELPSLRALFPANWQRRPHFWRLGETGLYQFPTTVTPWLRWPIYHTAAYVLGGARTTRLIERSAAAGEALSYPLHAIDVLGLAEDRVNPSLACHPGMRKPLPEKRGLLARVLEIIGERFEARSFAERLEKENSAAA